MSKSYVYVPAEKFPNCFKLNLAETPMACSRAFFFRSCADVQQIPNCCKARYSGREIPGYIELSGICVPRF